MRTKAILLFFCTMACTTSSLKAQEFSLSAGTDIPYQFNIGAASDMERFIFSYRTGLLVPPYSDIILKSLEELGTDEIYIDLLSSAYRFGWMNGLGAYIKIGRNRRFHLGPEIRLDYLSASDTPAELIEAVTEREIRSPLNPGRVSAKLGLTMAALGMRIGRTFFLDPGGRHTIRIQLSACKHITTQSLTAVNGVKTENLNTVVDNLLWEDVFKIYGYIGGLGVSYAFYFGRDKA